MSVSFFLFFNAFAFLKRLQILETFAVTFPLKYRGKRTGPKENHHIFAADKRKSPFGSLQSKERQNIYHY